MLAGLGIRGDDSHALTLLIDSLMVVALVNQLHQMRQNIVLPQHFRGQIYLHNRACFHVAHRGVKPGPDFQRLNGHRFLRVETISAHLLEFHIPHYVFEEYVVEHELFLIVVINIFREINGDRVLNIIHRAFAYDLIRDQLMTENILLEWDVKGEFF